MIKIKELKKRFKIYLLKRKVKRLKRDIDSVELNLYFYGWSGADCIEETNYLFKKLKHYEKEIISINI